MTWEDQQNINTFGRLNTRFQELQQDILAKKVRRKCSAANEVAIRKTRETFD